MLNYRKLDTQIITTGCQSINITQPSVLQIEYNNKLMLCINHKEESISFISRAINALRNLSLDKFSYLTDLTAMHYLEEFKEMTILYNIKNIEQSFDFILTSKVNKEISTVTDQFKCADWLEREVFDMYGVWFKGHPQLRRILTDYGFRGFPLRKDFPLHGFKELRYDFEVRHLLYVAVKLTQNFRTYFFKSQWDHSQTNKNKKK